ncbi:MAG TPA: hypothetical protein VGE74_33000 [Gemmata sp.]
MRYALASIFVLFAAGVHGADDSAKASATLDGKVVQFPEKGIAGGVKATIALLESCHDSGTGTAADLKKAQAADHVRLVFAKPIAVTILGDKLEVSELVLTQPLNTGVFWLRCGDKVIRCTKYQVAKEKDFIGWRNEARAAK